MGSFRSLARILAWTVFAVAICVPVVGQSAAQSEPSLGEVAKQKPVKKAKRVITDDDMPRHEPEATEPAATSASASEDQPKDATDADKDDKSKTPDAAAKPQDPEQKLKDARNEVEVLRHTEALQQELYDGLRDRLKNETESFRKDVLEDELRNADQNMAAMRQRRENAEKQVSELEAAKAEKQKKSTPPPTDGGAAPAEQ